MKRQPSGFQNRINLPLALIALFLCAGGAWAQDMANLFFLHHSTGNGLIVEGNMRAVIKAYNSQHSTVFAFWDHGYNWEGLRNPDGEFTETSYEIPNDNTDPDGLYYLWVSGEEDAAAARNAILGNHQVIAFKSCFPASAITNAAMLSQYKTWYLGMRNVFDQRLDKLFIVISTPPLHRLATDATQAANARAFANWLKSADYLGGHSNVVCFDLFDSLANANNVLRYEYEGSHDDPDSHPNELANQTVGPVFAQFMMTSAAAYAASEETNAPPAPTGLSATDGRYPNRVFIRWIAAESATGYEVWRNTADNITGALRQTTTEFTHYNDITAAVDTVYYYWVKALNANGASEFSGSDSGYSSGDQPLHIVANDYDGDGVSDMAIFDSATGHWYVRSASGPTLIWARQWGWTGAIPVPGDYSGDGRSDLAVFDNNTGWWFVLDSDQATVLAWAMPWGWPGVAPVPGDYNGDGRSDFTVFDSNTGWWFALDSDQATILAWAAPWGWIGAIPVSGDYNGDGRSDFTVFDTNTGYWFSLNANLASVLVWAAQWGWPGAVTVPGDYNGDGTSDFAVFDTNTGSWFALASDQSSGLAWDVAWGWPGAAPVPGDYDGDGVNDLAVFDTNTGLWYIRTLAGNVLAWAIEWGWPGAVPVGGR